MKFSGFKQKIEFYSKYKHFQRQPLSFSEKSSDVNRQAKTARPGLGRFGPSHFGQAQARPQPGQAGPSQAGRA